MTKIELIKSVAEDVGISQKDAGRALDCIIKVITESIQHHDRIEISGLGVFKKFRSAAVSRPNPQDRTKTIHTPERNTVKFKPSPALKVAVQ
jgi:DNA-binding protein HU-beta